MQIDIFFMNLLDVFFLQVWQNVGFPFIPELSSYFGGSFHSFFQFLLLVPLSLEVFLLSVDFILSL